MISSTLMSKLYDVVRNEKTQIPAYIFPYVHGVDYRVRALLGDPH